MSSTEGNVNMHLEPLSKALWDALPTNEKSRVFNNLIAYGLQTPKGAYLVKENTDLLVDSTDGVVALIEKETSNAK